MNSVQITIDPLCLPRTCCHQPSLLCFPRRNALRFSGPSIKLAVKATQYQQLKPVCLSGDKGKGNSANDNDQSSPWGALDKAMGSFKKGQSVEELLRQQMQKQEYFDEGSSIGDPPRGGNGGNGDGGGESGSGGEFGEPEDEDGGMEEVVQVTLATLGFIFVYIYIIQGEELTLLARDYIKYRFGGSMSVRLRSAMEGWEDFCKSLTQEAPEEDPYWLEREIMNTTTWWDSPERYRRMIKQYIESSSDD